MTPFPFKVDLDEVDSGCSICVRCGYISSNIETDCPNDHFDTYHSMIAMTPAVQAGIVVRKEVLGGIDPSTD